MIAYAFSSYRELKLKIFGLLFPLSSFSLVSTHVLFSLCLPHPSRANSNYSKKINEPHGLYRFGKIQPESFKYVELFVASVFQMIQWFHQKGLYVFTRKVVARATYQGTQLLFKRSSAQLKIEKKYYETEGNSIFGAAHPTPHLATTLFTRFYYHHASAWSYVFHTCKHKRFCLCDSLAVKKCFTNLKDFGLYLDQTK